MYTWPPPIHHMGQASEIKITMQFVTYFLLLLSCIIAQAFTHTGNIYTSNGSSSDTQAAINAAPGGSTILFNPGTYNWSPSSPVVVHKSLTLEAKTAGTVTIQSNLLNGFLWDIKSGKNGDIRFNNLNFVQTANNQGSSSAAYMTIDRTDMGGPGSPGTQYTVIFTHCLFESGQAYNYMGFAQANGLIFSHCTFDTQISSYGLVGISFTCSKYGIYGAGGRNYWNTPDTMGLKADHTGLNVGDTAQGWDGVAGLNDTYIEDSTISNGTSGAMNGDDNSRIVIRHCTIIDASLFSHGQDTGPSGNRHYEVYNCTMKNVNGMARGAQHWWGARGAVYIVANNVMDIPNSDKSSIDMQCQQCRRQSGQTICQTGYPAARQVGMGWSANSNARSGNPVLTQNGTGAAPDPCYFWGNTGPGGNGYKLYWGVSDYNPDECGNGKTTGDFVHKDRDFFVEVQRPGWVPYTYPHPKVASSIVPTPTSTPAPIRTRPRGRVSRKAMETSRAIQDLLDTTRR